MKALLVGLSLLISLSSFAQSITLDSGIYRTSTADECDSYLVQIKDTIILEAVNCGELDGSVVEFKWKKENTFTTIGGRKKISSINKKHFFLDVDGYNRILFKHL